MQVQNFPLPERKDLGPDVPVWFGRFMGPVGGHLTLVTTALQRKLSVLSNLNWDVKTVSIPHDTAVELRHSAEEPILGVHLLRTGLFDYAKLAWERVDGGRIRVKVKWDSAPTSDTEAVFLVLGAG